MISFAYIGMPVRGSRLACRPPDGYQALPPEAAEDACLADFHRRQDKFEEACEKMLMAVYDALYKAGPPPSILEDECQTFSCSHHHRCSMLIAAHCI